ncbi:MAG: ATP-binding protein [Candidatus Melainabacteria bacterium]|nr:ATP-binding protein [Candidatus Melainabacteria bacterium]
MTELSNHENEPSLELRKELAEKQLEIEFYKRAAFSMQAQIKEILSSIPLGLIALGEDDLIDATNQHLRTLFQYEAKELIGKSVQMLIQDIDITNRNRFESTGRKKTGELFPVELFINEVELQKKRSLFIHVSDLSTRLALEQFRANLVSTVSHDLRTPLTAMSSVLGLLRDGEYGEISESGERAVQLALISGKYMESILTNILDAQKLDSDSISLNVTETTCCAVVETSLSICQQMAQAHGISITKSVEDRSISVDEDRFVQVLVNVITNAIKFSPPGGEIQIQVYANLQSVFFEVSDEGPGIPEDMEYLIFNKFWQLHQTRENKSGFGLGLAIAKALLALHNGSISVHNRPIGCSFLIQIPI